MSFGSTLGGRVGGFVYGAIFVLAMLVALETPPPPGPFDTLVLIFGSVLVAALAHAYASVVKEDYDAARGVDWRAGLTEFAGNWPLVVPAIPPSLLFAASGFGWIANKHAFAASYAVLLAALFAVGYASQRRIGHSRARACLVGFGDLALGVLIVLLKDVLN